MNQALQEARTARQEAAEAKLMVEADRQSAASSTTSSRGSGKKDLGPMGDRKKMVAGGFEEHTEREAVVHALKEWVHHCGMSDLYQEIFAFPSGKVGYVTWKESHHMYRFIEKYKNTPISQQFQFENRALWCNVHKTRDERDTGSPLNKAMDVMKIFVYHMTGDANAGERLIPNLHRQQIIFRRQVVATITGDELKIDGSSFPDADADVLRTNIEETQGAFAVVLNKWKKDVAARGAATAMQV